MEEVVNADGENKEFEDIESLKNRFNILRKEHENLTNKQNEINEKISKLFGDIGFLTFIIADIKHKGKKEMDRLQNELYMMQRKMHSNQNTSLELDVDYKVGNKNETTNTA